MRIGRKLQAPTAIVITGLALLALGVPGAWAKSEILSFSSVPSTTQAGTHPTVITAFEPVTQQHHTKKQNTGVTGQTPVPDKGS
jgi:hypothetical protein